MICDLILEMLAISAMAFLWRILHSISFWFDSATALTRPLRVSCDLNILVSIFYFVSDSLNCRLSVNKRTLTVSGPLQGHLSSS